MPWFWSKSSDRSATDASLSALRVPELEPFDPEPQPTKSGVQLGAPHVRPWWRRVVETTPLTHTNLDILTRDVADRTRAKRIIICADGTWNEPNAVKPGEDAPTNVWLMYQLVKDRDTLGTPQLKFYHAGVGTESWLPRRMLDGMTGRGLSENMRLTYRFLVDHYNPGDHVYLFGFSRGAYTVRTLAGMMRNSGVIDRNKYPNRAALDKHIDAAFELYRSRTPGTKPSEAEAVKFRNEHSHPDFYIACIGVWDTVGSLGIPVESKWTSPIRSFNEQKAGFHDVELSAFVDCAFHALAVDEQRGPFKPTLWVQKPEGKAGGQIVEQKWFTGVHSDVGGGYKWDERGLANVALRWMLNRVSATCKIELDAYPLIDAEKRFPTTVALHDSMKWYYKALDVTRVNRRFERVLDDGDDTESLHRIIDACRGTFATRAFPLLNRPYTPRNVEAFVERRKAASDRRTDPAGSAPGAERRSGEDRRAKRDRRS